MFLLNVHFRPFPRALSSPSAPSSRPSASTTPTGRSRHNSPSALAGVSLAKWPTQPQTQVTRIQDLSHPQVSHKWLYHQRIACAGSVLTPNDYIANVQKRLGNRVWLGDGQCQCCGSFLDPQLEHVETCSNAEVVCAMKLADPGITTEPRGLKRQLAEMLYRRHSIVNCRITEMKSEN